jgi:4-amino-4-deoxy-L-arabinose transferase-like glycosyltransferase
MQVPKPVIARVLRLRLYWIPAVVLLALWLPGADQGWYRTDTHYYAAVGKLAFERAAQAQSLGEAVRALLFLKAGDEPYLNKPPLPFWIHGAFIQAFGLHVWSVRLPSLLAAIGVAWATALAVSRLGTRRIALVSVLVLATTTEFFRYTRAISLDLWTLLFMMIGVAMMAWSVRRGGGRGMIRAGVPIGLALMCKPLVALLVPVIVGVWLVWTGRKRLVVPLVIGAGVAVLVAAPWHVAAALEYPGTFLRTYFVQQSLDRAAGVGVLKSEPWWLYFRILAESYWPWLATCVLGVIMIARRWSGVPVRQRHLAGLAMMWAVVWLMVLTAFGGKAPRYLVTVFPFLSVISGFFLIGSPSKAGRVAGRVAFTWGPAIGLGAAGVVALVGVRVHEPRDPCWDQLLKELDSRPGAHLVCTPREHSIAANLVMLGRSWPSKVSPVDAPPGATLMMIHPTEQAPSGWLLIAQTREYILLDRAALP